MATNEVTISNVPISQQAWTERLRELCCRFIGGNDPAAVGAIVIFPPSNPLSGLTSATIECFSASAAAAIVAGINAMAAPWYGQMLSAVQGTDS